MNTVVIMGRFVSNPELRYTQSNTAVTSFTLAVNRPKSKDKEQAADFIDCVAWRNTAEFLPKYFGKGDMIGITGHLQTRLWEDKNGNKRKTTEVLVDRCDFCGSRNSGASGEYNDKTQDGFMEFTEDGDVPF